MKKIICLIVITTITLLSLGTLSNAVNISPEYDATFDNGKGIFYANGNAITINKNQSGETIVTWDGGQQKVESTVRIIGGGKEGTSFETSNITMQGGTVSHIYGGGASLNSTSIATVTNSNVVINGGTVLQTVYGGGLLFTITSNSNITVNGGTIKSICGGGSASASISGVAYSAGVADDLLNSKNRVIDANIIINGGKIDTELSTSGSVFGGGQGYSYAENATITILSGDLSKAYVTGSGSNGYTKNVDIQISGGNVDILQTVNRGQMESASVKIDGGSVNTAYIGGENDPSVTGTISSVDFAALGGTITNLYPGVSGNAPIVVNQEDYKIVLVQGVVDNVEIGGKEVSIKYSFEIVKDSLTLNKDETVKLQTKISTDPVGYEYLFSNEKINWNSIDNTVATIDENGIVTGIKEGNTVITADVLGVVDTIRIEVVNVFLLVLIMVIVIGIVALVGLAYVVFNSLAF